MRAIQILDRSCIRYPRALVCKGGRSCDRGSEVWSGSPADKTGMGQFLQRNRRILTEEGVVIKILSRGRVGLIFAIAGASVVPVLASESASSF